MIQCLECFFIIFQNLKKQHIKSPDNLKGLEKRVKDIALYILTFREGCFRVS